MFIFLVFRRKHFSFLLYCSISIQHENAPHENLLFRTKKEMEEERKNPWHVEWRVADEGGERCGFE